jgi:uroporphyrin-III C-methyltransferase
VVAGAVLRFLTRRAQTPTPIHENSTSSTNQKCGSLIPSEPTCQELLEVGSRIVSLDRMTSLNLLSKGSFTHWIRSDRTTAISFVRKVEMNLWDPLQVRSTERTGRYCRTKPLALTLLLLFSRPETLAVAFQGFLTQVTSTTSSQSLSPSSTSRRLPGQGRGARRSQKWGASSGSAGLSEWGIPSSADLTPLNEQWNGKGTPPKDMPNGGRVTLVGSGPGDPDLLTVSAYRLLTENPDALVIADRLVSPEILNLVTGEIRTARKLPGCADLAQEEIYWWVHQALAQGRHVIRLKIGDPFVFGRGGEEVLTFRRFGVEPVVIPGVSAAFSAPLLGSIPVTHRGVSNQVVMCTGYGREGTSPDLIRYHKEQTVVFLMAVGRLKELCQRLEDQAGYPADTPVAIVEKAGCPDQRTVTGDMRSIARIADRHAIKPPSTIIVGEVVNVLIEKDRHGAPMTGLVQNFTSVFA